MHTVTTELFKLDFNGLHMYKTWKNHQNLLIRGPFEKFVD
jgi:hypothetical protein